MSRKHFTELAYQISQIADKQAREAACFAVCEACRKFNAAFDVYRFQVAAGVREDN